MTIRTKSIDHLGIVSGICKELGLVELIDSLVSSDPQRKLSVGEGIYALILNGLCFGNSTLYLSGQYFEDKPVEHLFRSGLEASDFTSHSLSSSLDAVYDYGIQKLFLQISLRAIQRYGIVSTSTHLDGTTFMVHGDKYKSEGLGEISLKKGHNKQHRHDLNQFVLELICSNREGIPLFMSVESGNETDKTAFSKVLQEYQDELLGQKSTLSKANNGHVVADSALYSADTLQKINHILWISRVPETIKSARKEIELSKSRTWTRFEGHEGYKYQEVTSNYGGQNQRWLILYSEASAKSGLLSVESAVVKQEMNLEKGSKSLYKEVYESELAAQSGVHKWFKGLKSSEKAYLKVGTIRVQKHEKYAVGKRKVDAQPEKTTFSIQNIEFERQEEAIDKAKHGKATFILATNDLDKKELPPDKWLTLYKDEQQNAERGFKFLKDPVFMLDKIFLKLPRRIMAMGMVMVLCLLVYTLAQFKFRKALIDQRKTVNNQLNKPTQRPTMRWIFSLLRGIQIAYVEIGNKTHRNIINLTAEQLYILNVFGGEIQGFYTL